MKSLPKILSLLTISTMMVSCNEKISPELQSGNSSSTTTPPTTTTSSSNFVFKLEQDSPALLRYKMHKTGEGNNDIDCKIEESTFSTSLFKGAPTTYDITCFLEAEEQSLFYNGADIKLTASPNLCETISYAPYNFFQYQPGNSSKTVNTYKCPDGIASITDIDPLSHTPVGGGTCDQAVQVSPSISINPIPIPTTDQSYCEFDYTLTEGPNCDSGVIDINAYTYSETLASCSDTNFTTQGACTGAGETWTPRKMTSTLQQRRVYCGGKTDNCRAGVGIQNVTTKFKGLISEVEKTVADTEFVKKINLPAPNNSSYYTNLSIANFVRQCSGSIDNTNPINFSNSTLVLQELTEIKTFNPNVLDRYSLAIPYWLDTLPLAPGTKYFSNAANTLVSYASRLTPGQLNGGVSTDTAGWTKRFYAADSFMPTAAGMSASGSLIHLATANPYYAFYCLNNALDVKARIRLVVRDWDQFPDYVDQDFELLSDVFYQASPLPSIQEQGRMDTTGSEIDFDSNPFNNFNDVADWDDFYSGDKALNGSCSGREPTASEQWYSPNLFPGSGL